MSVSQVRIKSSGLVLVANRCAKGSSGHGAKVTHAAGPCDVPSGSQLLHLRLKVLMLPTYCCGALSSLNNCCDRQTPASEFEFIQVLQPSMPSQLHAKHTHLNSHCGVKASIHVCPEAFVVSIIPDVHRKTEPTGLHCMYKRKAESVRCLEQQQQNRIRMKFSCRGHKDNPC